MCIKPVRVAFVVLAYVLSSVAPLHAQDSDLRSAQVDEIFADWDRPGSPGYAVAVIRDGEFVHKRGYGMANLDEETPLGPQTVFCVMSLSKSFATVCAAIAMDRGHFSPDDDIRKYIPELRDFEPPITIRHLLTCHSGLRDFYHGMAILGRDMEDAYSSEDVFDLILRQKNLLFEPGEKWGYSNSDWFVFAEIIHRTTGQTLREFATERLFEPLGMTNTFFGDTPELPIRNRAVGHGHNGETFIRLESNSDSWNAAGGLLTTINDMLHWDAFLRRNDKLPAGEYLLAFLRDGSLLGNEQCLSAFPKERYRGLPRFWYTGGGMGFMAHFVRFPEYGLSIIAFGNNSTNRGWHDSVNAVQCIADVYLDDVIEDDEDSVLSTERWPKQPIVVDLMEERLHELSNFVGPYSRSDDDFVELALHDGKLHLDEIGDHWTFGVRKPLATITENRFRTSRGYNDFELSFGSKYEVPTGAEHADQSRPLVHIAFENGKKQTWMPVHFASYKPSGLQSFAGEYYCDDLESVHRVTAFNGQLFVQYNFGRKRLHRPTTSDSFLPVAQQFCIPIKFARSARGEVVGFTMEFDRSGEVSFKKRTAH